MKRKINMYLQLTKPKVTLLNLLVGVTCFVLAAFPAVSWFKLGMFATIGYLAAGGCGVLNSFYDRDVDKLMPRTSRRAIPAGQVPANEALMLGGAMISTSFALSYFLFNPLTALMLGLGTLFYLIIYTVWLKRISPWNVVIGGFAGCFAGLSGWTAAANTLSLMPLLIAMIDFLWTPGHLWGLAIKKMKEYKVAGVPMLPVKVGVIKAAQVVFWLNVLTVASSFLFPVLHLTGVVFTVFASGAGIVFLFQNRGLLFADKEIFGFKVFIASMPYLACLMVGLIVDKLLFI
jgi:protoheme IX farnesyltransferase